MNRLSTSGFAGLLLVSAALALGACGDDEKGTTGAATNADTTTAETSTTGTERTTTTGEDRTTTRKKDRTNTSEAGDDKGGRTNSGSGKGGSGKSGGSDDSGSTSQPAAQPGNVKKVAKTVCNSFLPKQIQKELESGKRKPESVAKDYSRGFPAKQQEAAYEGCLAGLKARS